MNTKSFSDQEMTLDVLSTQKSITGGYNTTANEASEPAVKSAMMSILDDEHKIQHDVFLEMQKRGWYQTEPAPENKINQTKQKFAPSGNTCCC